MTCWLLSEQSLLRACGCSFNCFCLGFLNRSELVWLLDCGFCCKSIYKTECSSSRRLSQVTSKTALRCRPTGGQENVMYQLHLQSREIVSYSSSSSIGHNVTLTRTRFKKQMWFLLCINTNRLDLQVYSFDLVWPVDRRRNQWHISLPTSRLYRNSPDALMITQW